MHICRTPADLCWTLSRILQVQQGAPKIRLRCLQSRFWAASFSACIYIASFFRPNCLMLKIWKSLLHAFMHDHSRSQPPQPFMHVKDQGSCGENYIPYLQSDNRPLPTTAGIPTYSRQKDGRRICHPGLSCIHCMHGYIVCKRCMDIYICKTWLAVMAYTAW